MRATGRLVGWRRSGSRHRAIGGRGGGGRDGSGRSRPRFGGRLRFGSTALLAAGSLLLARPALAVLPLPGPGGDAGVPDTATTTTTPTTAAPASTVSTPGAAGPAGGGPPPYPYAGPPAGAPGAGAPPYPPPYPTGAAPGATPPAYPPGAYPPPWTYPYAPPGWQGVFVELRTTDPRVHIDRVLATGNTVTVCEAPCRRILDRKQLYVIEGDGIPSTSQFVLPDDRSSVTLDVRAGSSAERALGMTMVVVGGALAVLGYTVVSLNTSSSDSSTNRDPSKTGLVLLAIGIPVGLLGVLLNSTGRTSVTSSTGSTFTDDARPSRAARPRIALTPGGLEF